jgi:ADP-ribose pyrophosphatase
MAVQPWKRIEPTVINKLDRRTLVTKTFQMPDGKTHVFTTLHAEGSRAGCVIAITRDKQVVIARQFRVGPERIMDELPGGGIEEGEDPQTGVIRELKEETGYIPGNVTFIGTTCRDAYTNTTWYYYLATDCEPDPNGQDLDTDEYVEVALISIDQLIENAKKDRLSDPTAVLFAYEELLKLK